MISFLLSLFLRLEENGIKTSLGERLDTFKSLLYIDISNRERFINTLTANLAHNLPDSIKIREIIVGSGRQSMGFDTDVAELSDRIKNDSYFRRECLKRIIFDNNFEELFPFLSQWGKMIDITQVAQRLYSALFWEKTETDFLNELLSATESNSDLRSRLNRILKAVEPISLPSKKDTTDLQQKSELASIPFSEIRDRDLSNLRKAIRIAARKISKKIHLCQQAKVKRILNLHRTFRTNSMYENIPFQLQFKNQRRKRRNLIILCDMSESVRDSAFIMLTFINELSLLFKDVRSFAFINDITDITRIVKKRDIHNIIASILAGGVPNLFGNSNYSISFHRFYDQYRGILRRDTIIIIIGDGRNNYNAPSTYHLKVIKRRVHRLYWFAPEPKRLWGTGDSLLQIYTQISDKAFQTCNLNQLSNAIMKIAN